MKFKAYMRVFFGIFAGVVCSLVVVMLVSAGMMVKTACQRFMIPSSYKIQHSHLYSASLRVALEQTLASCLANATSSFSVQALCTTIKKKFPVLKNVQARLGDHGALFLTCEGTRPLWVINNRRVLGNKHRFFEPELFVEYELKTLAQINLAGAFDEKIDQGTYKVLSKIPEAIFQEYTIEYSSLEHIMLIPRNSKEGYKVLVDSARIDDAECRNLLALVKEDVLKSEAEVKRKRGTVVLDMRFKNNIVVRRS